MVNAVFETCIDGFDSLRMAIEKALQDDAKAVNEAHAADPGNTSAALWAEGIVVHAYRIGVWLEVKDIDVNMEHSDQKNKLGLHFCAQFAINTNDPTDTTAYRQVLRILSITAQATRAHTNRRYNTVSSAQLKVDTNNKLTGFTVIQEQ